MEERKRQDAMSLEKLRNEYDFKDLQVRLEAKKRETPLVNPDGDANNSENRSAKTVHTRIIGPQLVLEMDEIILHDLKKFENG